MTDASENNVERRTFIKAATVAASGFVAAPFFVHADDKAGTKRVTVGSGEHTYECIHDWGLDGLPKGHNYGGASHGTAVDSSGLIYITHHGGPGSIYVFDADAKFVRSMGEFHQSGGHGIDIRKENGDEYIYLAPNNSAMDFVKMTLKGEVLWKRNRDAISKETGKYEDPSMTFRPTNTSFRPDGGYYLGDGYGSNFIFQFDKNDKFVRTVGGTGEEDGKFRTPHGQWLDDRDGTAKLVVADRANKRLQWFDMDGQHLKTLDGFLFPADVDIRGEVMAVPDLHARITLLDKDNKVIVQLGDDEEWRQAVLADNFKMRGQRDRWQPGKFVHPHDACFDKDGNIFVAEWVVTGRVTKLVKVS